eukprot:Tbor_TRINITY_DN3061_c0_g1::TRINITY_DN3061_c0_g1_i1::g.17359::m.17359
MLYHIYNGFRSWNEECLQLQKNTTSTQLQLTSALAAEDAVGVTLDIMKFKHYLRKRVYVPEQHCNREIDCIGVVKDRILVIEVKNWRGQIWSNGVRWYQRASKSGQTLEFGDIYEEAEFKTEALRKHFEYDHKVKLPKECFVSCIVFTNPNCTIDLGSVGQKPYVFDMPAFQEFIKKETNGNSGEFILASFKAMKKCENTEKSSFLSYIGNWVTSTGSLIRNLAGYKVMPRSDALTSSDRMRIEQICDRIRTWDVISFHNGTVKHGDVVAIEVPSANFGFERRHILGIEMSWASQSLVGLLGAMWHGTACIMKIILTKEKRVNKKKDKGKNKLRDPDGNIVLPCRVQNTADVKKSDRLLCKFAGQTKVQEIRLNQIKTIELCSNPSAVGAGTFFINK